MAHTLYSSNQLGPFLAFWFLQRIKNTKKKNFLPALIRFNLVQKPVSEFLRVVCRKQMEPQRAIGGLARRSHTLPDSKSYSLEALLTGWIHNFTKYFESNFWYFHAEVDFFTSWKQRLNPKSEDRCGIFSMDCPYSWAIWCMSSWCSLLLKELRQKYFYFEKRNFSKIL